MNFIEKWNHFYLLSLSLLGTIYKSIDGSTSECIRVICTNNEIATTWKRVDSNEPIQSCMKGN